jgi:hypothetical protein
VILLHDTTPDQEKDLLELKAKKTKAAPVTENAEASDSTAPVTPPAPTVGDSSGQGLFFVDPDEVDANVPGEFEYESEGEDDRMED